MLIGILIAISLAGAGAVCFGAGAFASPDWLWMLPLWALGFLVGLAVVLILALWIICAFVDLEKTQQKDSPLFRKLINLLVPAAITITQTTVHTQGLEKTPEKGRFLLVCNHLNEMDPVVLLRYFRKSQLAFISKRENDKLFLVGKLMHKILCQPINRENDREALKTILRCVDIIRNDLASVAVFPEGYVSMDQKLHPFRSGVFKIAQRARVPIVVCTLRNTQHVFHNALRLHRTHVHLHLVGVIPAEELAGNTAVEIGNRVHAMMAADLGPENVLRQAPETGENT